MKQKDKVISQQTAKKLDELGVKVESERTWYNDEYQKQVYLSRQGTNLKTWKKRFDKSWELIPSKDLKTLCESTIRDIPFKDRIHRAYDVAELGEMLKNITDKNCYLVNLPTHYRQDKFWGFDEFINKWEGYKMHKANTEAEIRGKKIVWLIKNRHIKVEDINNSNM